MIRKTKIIGVCKHCNTERWISAKGSCKYCYGKYESPIIICKKCGKEKHHQAKGMCFNCYQKTGINYERIKDSEVQKYFGLSYAKWNELRQKCIICGFDKIVNLHHLDKNCKNNSHQNFVALCPNHHKMIHTEKYTDEIEKEIIEAIEKAEL